jgi:hypothetical protein
MSIESKFAQKVTNLLKKKCLLNDESDLDNYIKHLIQKDETDYDGELDIEGVYSKYKNNYSNYYSKKNEYDISSLNTNCSSSEIFEINDEFNERNNSFENNDYFKNSYFNDDKERDINEIVQDSIDEIIDEELNIDKFIRELFLCI